MRSYILFVSLASTSGFALLRALRTNQTRYWSLFAVAATFELYVHHLALLNVFYLFLIRFRVDLLRLHPITVPGRASARHHTEPLSLVSKVTTAFLAIGVGFLSVLPFYLIPLSQEEHRGMLRLEYGTHLKLSPFISAREQAVPSLSLWFSPSSD